MTYKHLFSRAFAANPDRLHFAAHSHHLWPDTSYDAHMQAWNEAAAMADHKWGPIMGEVWTEAQRHIASELNLPDPQTLCFSSNTHDFLLRIVSAIAKRPVRVLASNGEFHSFRRQMARWQESGDVILETVSHETLVQKAQTGSYDLIFASQVLFNSGTILDNLDALASLAHADGPWVVIDGYHGFMAVETDLSQIADKVFYMAGGYKYAMAGEGVCFLHAPTGFAPRPVATGWYAEFDDLSLPPGSVGYASDGRRFLGSTFDASGLYRFNAVQRMLAAEGLSTNVVSGHVKSLQDQLIENTDGTPLARMVLLNPSTDADHARFLAFKGDRASEIHAFLDSQDIMTDVRGDVLRIGFAIYHNAQDVDKLVNALRGFS